MLRRSLVPNTRCLGFIIFISFHLTNIFAQYTDFGKLDTDIEMQQIDSQTYILRSFADLQGIGRIGTNHLLYIRNSKAFLFDTPNDNSLAGKLYQCVRDSLHANIIYVSVSHWHQDHSGGLDTLNKLGVRSYSYSKTKELMLKVGLTPALNVFEDSIRINFEGEPVLLAFYGAAHTSDNIIGWIDSKKILFSGSIIRSLDNTSLGYMKDADVNAWPITVDRIEKQFGSAVVIIPGHGNTGDKELIDHTKILCIKKVN
jgi:metallo-beta-lactamase class B